MPTRPVPPQRLPIWQRGRPLKRWRYVGVFCPEVMLCVGDVRVGPLPQRFWAVAQPGRPIVTRTSVRRGGVELGDGRVAVASGDVRIDIALDEIEGVATTHADDVWTRKQAGARARGTVRVGRRAYSLDCAAVVDDTAGYHRRHTAWRWSAGVGTSSDGTPVGWNLVSGVNDEPRGSERAVWIDGSPREVGPVEFASDLSSVRWDGGELRFREWAAREDRTNLLLVRSSYRQPFGEFSGDLPGEVSLARGFGVMEWHDVYW
jgi:hypothetical protein